MSDVRVVVIDCTDTGASPPTATDPTWILPADPAVGELGRNGRHSERNRSHLLCNPKVWIRGPEIGGLQAPRLRHRPRRRAHPRPEIHPKVSGRTPRVPGRHRTRDGCQVILTGFTMSATSTSSVKQMKIPATT